MLKLWPQNGYCIGNLIKTPYVYGQDGTKRRDSCTIQLALFKPNIRTDRLVEQQVNAHPSLANSHSNCHFSAVLPQKQRTKLTHKLAQNRTFRSRDTVTLPQYIAQSTTHTYLRALTRPTSWLHMCRPRPASSTQRPASSTQHPAPSTHPNSEPSRQPPTSAIHTGNKKGRCSALSLLGCKQLEVNAATWAADGGRGGRAKARRARLLGRGPARGYAEAVSDAAALAVTCASLNLSRTLAWLVAKALSSCILVWSSAIWS